MTDLVTWWPSLGRCLKKCQSVLKSAWNSGCKVAAPSLGTHTPPCPGFILGGVFVEKDRGQGWLNHFSSSFIHISCQPNMVISTDRITALDRLTRMGLRTGLHVHEAEQWSGIRKFANLTECYKRTPNTQSLTHFKLFPRPSGFFSDWKN